MFSALVLDDTEGEIQAQVRELQTDDLPRAESEEVHLEVLYSSLNYKDGLAVTGSGQVIRGDYPIVPGIDLVGRVLNTDHDAFEEGDRVIGTGWQLGEVAWGGYRQEARVAGRKLVPLPDGLSPAQAMIIGTAGFTAMLSVMALGEHDVSPGAGEVVVTGASGGAGSIAVALLDALGHEVVASTGSETAHAYLRALGADRIVHRRTLGEGPDRPMESGRWAGAIDAVGGDTLATLIAQLKRHGSVASFGNAGGHKLRTTVLPFILRGVNLLGIDSNTCPNDRRRTAWGRLAQLLTEAHFDRIHARTISLADIPEASRALLAGEVQGRILVDVQGNGTA
ncbi:acrylyl-CoA reductase (NADPH) [Salinibacter ruber]|uniref:MDR family oxidoreductase n=1 Tax=Salinibacter ruber TaxID=146919 RepID=UPI00216A5F9C|nr:MDR family oxidoreductase [Salinibacter ruber]MCS3629536.1 acrylyl-CoA reductase (NADPH) [Salinibacter ruber]